MTESGDMTKLSWRTDEHEVTIFQIISILSEHCALLLNYVHPARLTVHCAVRTKLVSLLMKCVHLFNIRK